MKTQEQINREVAHAEARLPAARAHLMSIPGVMVVNVGIKATHKQATDEVAFLVYVKRKIPARELTDEQRIPRVVEGIPTDVVQTPMERKEADVLWGGVEASHGFCGRDSGTLGAIAVATVPNPHAMPGTPMLLTNHHVAPGIGDAVGNGCMCDLCCCECGVVGRVVDTRATPHLDASIALLEPGVPFSRAIIGIGAVTGIEAAQVGQIVLKFGHTTGLTKGRIADIHLPIAPSGPDDIAFTDQISIVPVAPTTDMSSGGDSGSVYVNAETRKVVALHHGAPGAGGDDHNADACHMTKPDGHGVADELKINFPNMGTAGAIPIAGTPEPLVRPNLLEEVLLLRRELERTEGGQRWLDLLHRHAPEVKHLVNHHRAAQVAWQRSQGPAFVAHFLKSARDATHRVPLEIGGMRAENAVLSMAAVLQEHGSVELARAISEHYLTALRCTQRAESAENLLSNATRLAGVHRGE